MARPLVRLRGGPVHAKEVLRFLRARRREKLTREDLFEGLYWLYCAALLSGFAVLYLGALLEGPPGGGAEEGRILAWVERLGVPALLVAFSAGLRWATWQGPVVFSGADVRFLLSSPIPRASLVRDRLPWGLAAGALVGVAVGLGLFTVSASVFEVAVLQLFAACILPLGGLGLLVGALGWQVERSVAVSRAVLMYGPAVPLAALALALASSFLPGGFAEVAADAASLSGPWGWALVPALAACGQPTPPWPLAASLLAVATVSAVGWALATAARVPTEELARRAKLRRGLYASIYTTDFRGAALVGREETRRLTKADPRRSRLPRPRRPPLAIPWRDAVWMLRNVGSVGWALAFCGSGAIAALAYPHNVFVILAAVLLGYLGASQIVETTRIESDVPGASRMLPYRHGDLILLHTPVPAALVTAVLALSCAAGVLAEILPGAALPSALLLCLPAAAALVCCAVVAAQRSRTLPVEVMQAALALGDAGGLVLVQWYARGPILALLALGVPGLFLAVASQRPSLPWASVLGAGGYLVLVATAGLWWIRRRRWSG